MIKIKRVYEQPSKKDGYRILIDRLWPRGLTKEHAAISLWIKDIAPSNKLRQWFAHDTKKWNDFQKKYQNELIKNKATIEKITHLEREKKLLTLVYAAKDQQHNNAVVLRKILQNKQ